MKTTKRLSIELCHREVSITVEGSTLQVPDRPPDAAETPAVCPTCGCPWISIAALPHGDVPAIADRIGHVLQQFGLHMQLSPAGQLQICQRSFEELKEKL